jgi:hypothetical protein
VNEHSHLLTKADQVVTDLRERVAPVRHLTARQVLSLHAELQQQFAKPAPKLTSTMISYAYRDVAGHPEWRASHLNPATDFNDLTPWLRTFSTDLAKAKTYQVTAEMVELAQKLTEANPSMAEVVEEELPSPAGFMWLDRAVPRPSDDDNGRPPVMFHAISWARVPDLRMQVAGSDIVFSAPGIRIREWGYDDSVDVYPRPLHLMGQTTLAISAGVSTRLPSHVLLHMLWVLMDTEVIATARHRPDRHCLQKASNIKSRDVTVITLARARHPKKDDAERRHVDWSCTWLVRGHTRKAPNGGTFRDGRRETWVKPYLKGPDGMPLRASDILYRLSHADY